MEIKKLNSSINKIDYIFHLGDIHIRTYKRHAEYKDVFSRLYDSLKQNSTENSVILLAGDIFHSKTDMTPELVDLAIDFLKTLSSICYTVVIPGNHDLNLNNKSRLDAISPVIKGVNSDKIFYLKESGIYKLADVYFIHFSILDKDINIDLNFVNNLDSTKIALYHGAVDSSVNDFGYVFRDNNINLDFFNNFDLVLLGDIHTHQFLTNRIAYCGSLIQQNYGESLHNHGYIKWNLSTFSGEFIKIKNDYGYYTLEIKDNNVPIFDDVPSKCRLRVKSYNISNLELNDIIFKIKKIYNPIEIVINKINNYWSSNKNNKNDSFEFLDNLNDIKYQNKLLENFLISNYKLDNNTIDLIKQINEEVNLEIESQDREIVRNIRWRPIRFEWSNMFSYGENNYVNFDNFKGIVGLFGHNAVGKSSFIDALAYCLFDKSNKDFKPANILNNKKDKFNCKILFEINDTKYFIERRVWKNSSGGLMYKVNFGFYDSDGKENLLNGINRWGTNKLIGSYIGTFENFILTTLSGQGYSNNFIDKGNSDKKDLIIQFAGLGLFDVLYDLASEKIKGISQSLKNLESENIEENLYESEKKYNEANLLYNKKNNELNELNKRVELINNEISQLKSKLINIDEILNLDDLLSKKKKIEVDILQKNNKIEKFRNDINRIKLEVDDYKSKIQIYDTMNIKGLYEELKNLEDFKSSLENEINILNIIIENEKDKMNKLKEVEYDPNCKYCMNNIFVKDAINTKKTLEEHLIAYKELNDKLNGLINIIEVKSQIKNDYIEYEKLFNKINSLEKEIYKYEFEIQNLENNLIIHNNSLKEINSKIDKYYFLEKSILFNNKINKEIENKNEEIKKLNNLINKINKEILHYYGLLKVEESNINAFKEKIKIFNELKNKFECYKYYISAVKRDGIPYDLISYLIPRLQIEINNILSQIVDFLILIELDENKNVNMYIVYDDNKYWSLELASGMEKFISSIAMRVALANIAHLPRPNFLIIDEGWGSLDSDNLNSVSMLFDYLKTQFDFVIIVSHIDQIRDFVDTILEIKKEDGFSIITCE